MLLPLPQRRVLTSLACRLRARRGHGCIMELIGRSKAPTRKQCELHVDIFNFGHIGAAAVREDTFAARSQDGLQGPWRQREPPRRIVFLSNSV